MIELSGGSAFFAKLWSAKGGREGRARERKKSEKTFRQKRRKKKGKMLGGTITDNDSIDGKEKEEEEREEEVALVLGLCPKRRSKLPTREKYFFVRKKSQRSSFFCFFQSFMAFSPPPRNSYFNNPSASFHLSVPEISIRYGSSVACGRRSTREKYKIYPKIASQRTQKKEKNGYCFSFASFSFSNPFPSPHFCPS